MVMILNKKLVCFTLILVLITLLLVSCRGDQVVRTKDGKPIIKIGYLPITHAAPLLQQATQAHEKYEIQLIKFSAWPDLMDALNTGRIDGASVLIQMAMKAKEKGIDLKAVALGHRDGNVIITAPQIHRVSDLVGKTFAIPNKYSTHHLLFYQMLKKANIPYDQVHVVELPPPEMPAALSEGRISGYVVAEPFGALAVTMGKGKVLYQSEEIWPNSIDCTLVLRKSFMDRDRNLAQTFVQDYVAAGEKSQQNIHQLHHTLKKHLPVSDQVMKLSLQWISYDDLKIERKSYSVLTNSLLEMKLSKKPPTYEEFVDMSLMNTK